jgi:hypothetical protein
MHKRILGMAAVIIILLLLLCATGEKRSAGAGFVNSALEALTHGPD